MKKIIVVGSCGLDRLLKVQKYPLADHKIRTTSYTEVGGGNAANTAVAMARLLTARIFHQSDGSPPISVQLLSKIGDDMVGLQIRQQLQESGVDISSKLFQITPQSTTGLTTIVVGDECHTRTCIHTPGTCGELSTEDLASVNLNDLFQGVMHVHFDSRHTEFSLQLAREAKRRSIPISLDVEKDRHSGSLDQLLGLTDILFTNEHQLEDYIHRLSTLYEQKEGRYHPENPVWTASSGSCLDGEDYALYAKAIRPSTFLARWHVNQRKGMEVIITQGHRGSLHVYCDDYRLHPHELQTPSDILSIEKRTDDTAMVQYSFTDSPSLVHEGIFTITKCGVLTDIQVVDTTGSGDAYMAAFLLSKLLIASSSPTDCMHLASWVAGQKLQGPGAQSRLPWGIDLDHSLGVTKEAVHEMLTTMISGFVRMESSMGSA